MVFAYTLFREVFFNRGRGYLTTAYFRWELLKKMEGYFKSEPESHPSHINITYDKIEKGIQNI